MGQIIHTLYAVSFAFLLVLSVRLMARGFREIGSKQEHASKPKSVTVHPELLDPEGNLLEDELLTVRFTGDNEPPASTNSDQQPDDSPPLAPR